MLKLGQKLQELIPIVNKIPLGITLLDRDMRIILVNKSVERSFGFKFEDVKGKFCYEVIGRKKICHECGVVKALKDGKVHFHEREVKPDLVTKNIAVPVKVGNEVVAVLEIGLDITDVSIIRKELYEKDREYQELFENSLDAIVITDLKGRFVRVNRGFEKLTGYSRDEIIGKRFSELVSEGTANMIFEKYNEAFRENRDIYGLEFEFFTKDGRRKVVEGNITLIKKDSKVVGFLGNFRDVTEKRRFERALYEVNDTLRLINKIMRHDLLNDLTIINAALSMYWETKDEEMLETANKSVERAIELIKRMREFEESTKIGELKEVNVRKLVERVAAGYSNLNGVEIKIEGNSNAIADEALASVFDNLIRNAITHGKSKKVDIEIIPNEFCEIRVADHGVGIPEKIKDRIFDEGFSYYGSTGLGLYIVKRVIERYGGVVWVEDNKPSGAVFVIKLRRPGSKPIRNTFMVEDFKLREVSETLERIFRIFNTISEHIVYHGKDRRIKWVNRAAAESVNAKPEELIGRFCYEVWHGKQSPCGGCPVYRAWESGMHEEGIIESSDGRIWYTRADPVVERGKVKGVVEITTEITEKMKLERRLKESEELFRTLAEKSLVGVYLIQDGVFKYVNPKLAEDFGYEVKDIVGKKVLSFIHPEDRELVAENMRKRIEGKIDWLRYKPRVVRKDGKTRIFEVFGTKITYNNKPAIIGTAIDITGEESYRRKLERYERFFINAHDLFFILDKKGKFIEVNPKFANLLGLKPEDLIGKNSREIVHPEDVKGLKEYFKNVLKGGKDGGERYEFRTKDGSKWFEVVEWVSGSEVEGIVREITERKRLEQKLKESEEMFRTLAEKSLVGIYLIQDGVFKYVNPKLAELWGYDVSEMVGRSPLEFIHPEDREKVRINIERRIKGEIESVNYVLRMVRKDGKVRYNEVYGSRVMYKGRPAVIGSLLDITERLELERAKLQAFEQIERNIENYAILVDQIRNPLAVIQGMCEITLNKEGLDELRRTISESVKRIEDVVERLDKGWLESETIRKFLKGELRKSEEF